MATLQDEQFSIDRELGSAVLSVLPQGWCAANLVIERRTRQNGAEGYAIRIEPPAGVSGIANPDDSVSLATRKLFILHRRYGTGLKLATYTFRRQDDGRWSWTAEYVYEN